MKSKLIKIFLFLLVTAGFCFGGYGEGTSVSGKILSRTEKTFSKVLNGSHEPLAEPIVEDLSSTEVSRDLDKNKIEDLLDEEVEKTIGLEKEEKVVVLLNVPFDESLLKEFRFLGGKPEHTYRYAIQGFSGTIPVGRIKALADRLGPNLKIIKKAKPIVMHLDKSVRIIRARDVAWTYGYAGTSTNPIAILDTGIDDSHTDLSGKVAAWHDTTSDNSPSPEDYQSHGTHVASTAAGSGAALGTTSLSTLTLTFTGKYPTTKGYGYVDMFELPSAGTVTLNMFHGQGSQSTWLDLRYPDVNTSLGSKSGTSDPLIGSWNVTATGTYFAISGQNDNDLKGDPYSTLEIFPYSQVGDGFNLFTGVAPNANLVGVKIFNNAGTGYDTNMYAAFDWLIANKQTYNIKVASMSAGLSVEDTDLRAAANNVVANGIVFTISAGNDYPNATIKDPALASKIICVGATNDSDQMTGYSSNGPVGSSKPDVVAPGGSFQKGSKITAVDTNDCDGETIGFADRQANDYTNMGGTSMSTPHVAGAAALVVQALEASGYTWNYTEADALKVKMLILMTANETNKNGESNNNPTLNRGGKDLVEGYGRINADAAIEAVTTEHTGSTEYATLGASSFDKKVWARKVNMPAGKPITFNLTVPSGADYDLYLYRGTSGSNGEPVILASSTSSSLGNTETITYTAATSETDYLVVKWVSGSGQFSLSSNLIPTPIIEIVTYRDVLYSQEDKFFNLGEIIYIQANVTVGGAPVTGATVTAELILSSSTTEATLPLIEIGSGIYRNSWNSSSHTLDAYTIKVTVSGPATGEGKAYFHLYSGSGISAYQLDWDNDTVKDYVLENKHLVAIFDGATNTDQSLLYLYQKDTDVAYNFANISDANSIGRGEITTSNKKGIKFHSFSLPQGENLASSTFELLTNLIKAGATTTQEKTLFSDGFESGNFTTGGWTISSPAPVVSTALPRTGSYAAGGSVAILGATTNTYTFQRTIDTTGCKSIVVAYYVAVEDAGAGTISFIASYSTNGGGTWTNFEAAITDNNNIYAAKSWDLSGVTATDNNPNFVIKFAGTFGGAAQATANDFWADDVKVTGLCQIESIIETQFNIAAQMKSDEVDYLVYKLSNFDEYIDDIADIFSPISGTLGSTLTDDRYHFGNGTDGLVSSLTPNTWTNLTTSSNQQRYVAVYDASNVISWVYFPNASTTAFQDVGAWYQTGKGGLRIRYDTTSATTTNETEYILAFTKGNYTNIDYWMPAIASGQFPTPNFMTAITTLTRPEFPANAWQMLSMPLQPDNPDPEAVLSDDLGTIFSDWLLARWQPFEEEYKYHKATYSTTSGWSQSTTTLPNFSPGLAYWLITALGPYDIYASGALTPNNDYYIHLSPGPATTTGGWNQIGVPFNYSVAWSSSTIKVRNKETEEIVDLDTAQDEEHKWMENNIWWRDGTSTSYAFAVAPEGQLDPWAGYWVHNFIECDLIVSPTAIEGAGAKAASISSLERHPEPSEASPERSEGAPSEGSQRLISPDWKLQLLVSAGSARDTYNFAGIAPEAKNDYDALDVLEPPPISSGVQLYFPHPDWSFNPGNYTQDIRKSAPKNREIVWHFEIKSDYQNKPITLKWFGLPPHLPCTAFSNPPLSTEDAQGRCGGLDQITSHDLSLTDLDAHQKIDLYNTTEYIFGLEEEGIRRFKLTAK